MNSKISVPCAYQGGKQRVAAQIVDQLLEAAQGPDTTFYDLCCGSGAVSIELVNRGIDPSRIVMLDRSSWGVFWSAVGTGQFDMKTFENYLSAVPADKRSVKGHMTALSQLPIKGNEAELYPILQSCSFGGKQIWRENKRWRNAFFRDYWEPTATSVRRSPANPMQPSATELRRRITVILNAMKGVTSLHMDIRGILEKQIVKDSVVYIDPPYQDSTGYAFEFDVMTFVASFLEINNVPVFVSEGVPLGDNAVALNFGGANGGISGSRKNKHQEWLNRF